MKADLELIALEEILAYQNDEVVYRFSSDFGLPWADSELIFKETLRWLWLCARRQMDYQERRVDTPRMPLASQAEVIDLMWHTFLLFTQDYTQFCERYFGHFIHHFPLSRADRAQLTQERDQDFEGFKARRLAQLKPVYEYIHDVLGAEVLVRWLEEFPERYGALKMTALR